MKKRGWSEAQERAEEQQRHNDRVMKLAWQKWLPQQRWDLWGTVTHSRLYSATARRFALEAFLKRLQELYGIGWCFWIEERGGINGRPHAHFVMRYEAAVPPSYIPASVIKHLWGKHGIAEVVPYDSSRNGAAYILKRMDEGMEYDFVEPTKRTIYQDGTLEGGSCAGILAV